MVLCAVLAAAAAGTSACGGGSSTPASPKPEHSQLTVGVVKGEIGALPLYTGVDRGYFKHKGLDVRIVDDFVNDQEGMAALGAGKIDVLYDDYAHAFETQSLGTVRLRLIAEGYVAGPGGVQLAELSSQGTVQQDVARAFNDPNGILVPSAGITDASTDITVPTLMLMNALPGVRNDFKVDKTSLTEHIKAMPQDKIGATLAGKTGTAAVLAEPYWTVASSAFPLSPLLDLTGGGNADMPLGGYFAQADHALDYVNTLAAFNDALNQAKTDSSQRSIATAELGAHYNYLTPQNSVNNVTTSITLGSFPLTVSADRLTRVLALAQKAGLAPYMDLSAILPTGAINNAN